MRSASLVALLAPVAVAATAASLFACAAPVDAPHEEVAATENALGSFGRSLAGTYDRIAGFGVPTTLTLTTDGHYHADNVIECLRAPCPIQHEDGTFTASASPDGGTLRLRPRHGTARAYHVVVEASGDTIELDALDGVAKGDVAWMNKEGKTCGGIAALACEPGLECVYAGEAHPDAAGTCQHRGALGTTCGGFAGLPCDDGLTCVTDPNVADAFGRCAVH